jgi:hypothetical protein
MSLNPFISILHALVTEYESVHRRGANLVLHALAAPLFWLGVVALALGLKQKSLLALGVGAEGVLAALAPQGLGHRTEKHPAPAFDSVLDCVVRLAGENLYVFPRFVLTGGWVRPWRRRWRWEVLS